MSRDPQAQYYDAGSIETLDIIKAKLTKEQYEGYLLGCALKYGCRMMWKHKDKRRDIDKAIMYLKVLQEEQG